MKIKNGDKKGDVDSLFICEESNTHYLLERKRHAGMDVIDQMNNTRTLYAELNGEGIKIVSVLFAEALSLDLIEKARENGFFVLNDVLELLPPSQYRS